LHGLAQVDRIILGERRELMNFVDNIKEKVSNLETKYYYAIGGAVVAIIILIILLVALSGFPGERFGDWTHGGEVARLVFNGSGSKLASSELSSQAKAFVWDLTSQTRLQAVNGNSRDSAMLAFAQDDKVLVTVGLDEKAWFWDIGTGTERRYTDIPLSSKSALSPDGAWLAYCKGQKTYVWNLMVSKKQEDVFDGGTFGERAVTFSPDSKILATGDSSGVLRLYEPEKKALKVPPRKSHKSAIVCVAFSPEGEFVGTASDDMTAKLWDMEGNEQVSFKGHEEAIEVVAVGPKAEMVLTGGRDRTARLWDGKSGREQFKFDTFRGKAGSQVTISADGSLAAIETAGSGIEVFETKDGTSVVKIEVRVSTFAFAPTGSTLFFGRSNGKIYTWTKGMQ
jgi:WD40 repeat protein